MWLTASALSVSFIVYTSQMNECGPCAPFWLATLFRRFSKHASRQLGSYTQISCSVWHYLASGAAAYSISGGRAHNKYLTEILHYTRWAANLPHWYFVLQY